MNVCRERRILYQPDGLGSPIGPYFNTLDSLAGFFLYLSNKDRTMRFGFRCKTRGCLAVLNVVTLAEISLVPVYIADDPQHLQCPDCGKTHAYYCGDVETFTAVATVPAPTI
jgi:hypothetical protein